MDVLARMRTCGIVPVVVLENADDAVETAKAMLRGGVDVMEITFRTAAELLAELKNRDPGLDLTANVLIRIMNANSVMLRNYYKVSYHSLPKRNNMKRFSLRYLIDIIVDDSVVDDSSGSPDMSDNIGHIALIELTGPTETN